MGIRACSVVLSVAAVAAVLPGTAFAATDTTPPTVPVDGGWHDQYWNPPINGTGVGVIAQDDSGISRVAVEEVGVGEVASKNTCGSHGCPTSYSGSLMIPDSTLTNGRHQYQLTATDAAGNV